MKRLRQVSEVILATLLLGSFAYPVEAVAPVVSPTVNPHGVYTLDTNECARCHTTHSALSAKLLSQTSQRLSCEVCHDGTQSNYNTKAGTYWNGTADKPALGGGFTTMPNASMTPVAVTSKHDIEASTAAPGGTATAMYLVCSSCHNPHGYPSTNNFRMLQKAVNGTNNITVTAVLTSITSMVGNPLPNLPAGAVQPTDPNLIARKTDAAYTTEIASYIAGVDQLCTACHSDYANYGSNNTASSAYTGSAAATWNYRHRLGVYMDGGNTTQVKVGDNYWQAVSYPARPLYTSLPTLGAATGAYVDNMTTGAGSLAAAGPTNSYYYLVTSVNYGDNGGAQIESLPGNSKASASDASGSITITWQAVKNAAGYKVYRALAPTATPPAWTSFQLMTTTPIYDTTGASAFSYTDNGTVTPTATTPPTTANTGQQAKVMCLTCHFAHGSNVAFTQITTPVNILSTSNSRLLRMNNRGVCENCHKKGVW